MNFKDLSFDEKSKLVNDLNCPINIFKEASKDEDYRIRELVAKNPRVPYEILFHMATRPERRDIQKILAKKIAFCCDIDEDLIKAILDFR